jgi:hypothetical protein
LKKQNIKVKGLSITIIKIDDEDYISLTDIALNKNADEPKDVIKNWMRSRTTIEFLGLWEQLFNPDFKGVEFDSFMYEAGSNSFTLSPSKWIESTNAKGIITKSGNKGGTYAQKDIAFEFASWVSSEFKLYLIKEFQRLKEEENKNLRLEWNLSRTLAKVNYHIHTDAIKQNLIPPDLSRTKQNFIYANEADLLNLALFGKTAKKWRDKNGDLEGNIRDYASLEQLIVLSNLESLNSVLIKQNIPAGDILLILNKTAIEQMNVLIDKNVTNKLLLIDKR